MRWGLCRVGRRRAAISHVSCTPSSNRTCGFPASGSPIIFVRRRAPQSVQMAHLTHHLVQTTSVMKEVIPPSFLSSPPGALVLAPKPKLQLAPSGPVHLMECPIAIADPEVGTPPIQDRVQLLDHHADLPVRRNRSHCITDPLPDIAARLLAWPHQQHPPRSLPELEAEEREAFCQRRQPTLLLVHHQTKSGKLGLQLPPPHSRLLFRPRQQHHVIRVTDQPDIAESDSVAPAPLTIYFVQKDIGQRWRNHSALRRTSIRMSHLAFLHNSRFQPSSDQTQDLNVSDPTFHQL